MIFKAIPHFILCQKGPTFLSFCNFALFITTLSLIEYWVYLLLRSLEKNCVVLRIYFYIDFNPKGTFSFFWESTCFVGFLTLTQFLRRKA